MTNFNERTNTLLYKNISLTLYSRKGWCWLCVRDEMETGTDCYISTPSSSEHCSTSFAFWLGGSIVAHWGPKPSACHWLSIRQLISNWPQLQLTQVVCVLVIFLFDIHLLPLFFRLFTLVHLLIDGSVEGQYVTVAPSPTSRCSSYWKGRVRVALDYNRQLDYIYIYNGF